MITPQNIAVGILIVISAWVGVVMVYDKMMSTYEPTFGAPSTSPIFQKSLVPLETLKYSLGTTTPSTVSWLDLIVQQICLNGVCRTTWPAGGSGGGSISTSTDVTAESGLAYWTAEDTLSGTSSPTVGGIFATSTATSSLYGGLNVLRLFTNSIEATSTSVSSVFANPITETTLTSALILTGAGGLHAEYAGTSCTNQFPRSLSALGAATCESIVSADVTDGTLTADDLGADSVGASELNATDVETELEAVLDLPQLQGTLDIDSGGTNATRFSNGLLWFNGTSIEATSTSNLTVSGIFATTSATSTFRGGINAYQGQFNNIEATSTVGTSTVAGGISIAKTQVTTFFDALGASFFRIYANASVALASVAGVMGIDTTTGQLRWHDGTNEHIALDEVCKTFNMASTTGPIFDGDEPFGAGVPATTTYSLNTVNQSSGFTLSSITCQTDAGVALLSLNNAGSNPTFSHLFCKAGLVAGQNASTTFTSNNTFAQYADARIQIGSATGTPPDVVYGSVCFKPTSN